MLRYYNNFDNITAQPKQEVIALKKIFKGLLILITAAFLMCGNMVVYAQQDLSLLLKYITESGPVTDCPFKLYYVMTPDGNLAGDFANLNIEVGDLTDSNNMNRLASTLAAYAATGFTESVAEKSSNALGHTDFDGLSQGVYLVTGPSTLLDNKMYTPKPALISFSGSTQQVTANIKYTMTTDTSELTTYTVQKIWADQKGSPRPSEITVQLYKNGKLYDEVTLSAKNSWKHSWEGLSVANDWSVIEKTVPHEYVVSITVDEKTFTITNKWTKPSSSTETSTTTKSTPSETSVTTATTKTSEHTSQTTVTTTTPVNTTTTPVNTTTGSTTTTPPELPQTGQLRWPIPVLFISGAVLFLIGFIAKRAEDKNEKQ